MFLLLSLLTAVGIIAAAVTTSMVLTARTRKAALQAIPLSALWLIGVAFMCTILIQLKLAENRIESTQQLESLRMQMYRSLVVPGLPADVEYSIKDAITSWIEGNQADCLDVSNEIRLAMKTAGQAASGKAMLSTEFAELAGIYCRRHYRHHEYIASSHGPVQQLVKPIVSALLPSN